jgi:SpoVK/Ycf46/Vps4 family AAA+-type ATPase
MQSDPGEPERHNSGPLNFDTFLNCLDGVQRAEGVFTIITTNQLDKIDPALGQPRKKEDGTIEFISTRPGRVDKAIELTYMELADKKRMAVKILGEYPDAMTKMMQYLHTHAKEQETPAQFQERCAQIALRYFWDEQQSESRQYVLDVHNLAEHQKTPATATMNS